MSKPALRYFIVEEYNVTSLLYSHIYEPDSLDQSPRATISVSRYHIRASGALQLPVSCASFCLTTLAFGSSTSSVAPLRFRPRFALLEVASPSS